MPKTFKSEEEKREYLRAAKARSRRKEEVGTSGELVDPALPWPLNKDKAPRWGEGVGEYVAPTDEEKEAMTRYAEGQTVEGKRPKEATEAQWRYALERAALARKYARMFPHLIAPSERVYQDPVWQWENEARKALPG